MASGLPLPGSGKLSGNCGPFDPDGGPRRSSQSQEPDGPSNRRLAADSGSWAAERPVSVTQQTLDLSRSRHPVASQIGAKNGREALDDRHRNLVRPEAEYAPAAQSRLKIFLQIGIEPGGPIVATVHPDAALDLDEATRRKMRKIGPPTPSGVEAVFPLHFRSPGQSPESQECFFEAGARGFRAEAEAGHDSEEKSTDV
jgi:hypothetical protein